MVKHIVFWRFFETAGGRSRGENIQITKSMLETMQGKVPGIKNMEVGINLNPSDQASDLVLYSEFNSWDDLDRYQSHPEHQKVKDFLSLVREERRVIDYQI